MITTVHEDDLATWYSLPNPVGKISIRDFELDDYDFSLGDLGVPKMELDELVETDLGGRTLLRS